VILAILLGALAASGAHAEECHAKTAIWPEASGPVAGYEVEVSRDGGAFAPAGDAAATTATIEASVGQVVRVRVRAFATDATPRRTGPWSPESEAVVFCPPLGAPGAPTWSAGESAVLLTEPSQDSAGTPLSAANPLWACVAWSPGEPADWRRPTSSAGGGTHVVAYPTLVADLPRRYVARCIFAAGWGPEATAVASVAFAPDAAGP
jgi:hypothetical protein